MGARAGSLQLSYGGFRGYEAGGHHVCGHYLGSSYCWGRNDCGQLGRRPHQLLTKVFNLAERFIRHCLAVLDAQFILMQLVTAGPVNGARL